MPSFDIVNNINMQEVDNSINMVKRDIMNRYDFKNSKASLNLDKQQKQIQIYADNSMQIQTIRDMLEKRVLSRKISIKSFSYNPEESGSGMSIRQTVQIKEGIDKDIAKKICNSIKQLKLKIQVQIQGDQLRVTGKKIDDLQTIINYLNEQNMQLPLQYINMKK